MRLAHTPSLRTLLFCQAPTNRQVGSVILIEMRCQWSTLDPIKRVHFILSMPYISVTHTEK